MANWNRNNQVQDWDPMRDDYNDSTFDAQYPDDYTSRGVHLDQCRLYITNVPKTLNEEGLRTAFAKYGTLVEVRLRNNAQKQYGLVTYETPGEAKLAMMKLNRTDPLKLNIHIAHKVTLKTRQAVEPETTGDVEKRTRYTGTKRNQSSREDRASVASRERNVQKTDEGTLSVNGDGDMENVTVDGDMRQADNMDPELHLQLVQMEMMKLKLQEEQLECKQRMLILNRAGKKPTLSGTNRHVLSNGKILIRNTNERSNEATDSESLGVGSGDAVDDCKQPKPPSLQPTASRYCVVCSSTAIAYCSRCGVTPYCSSKCQQRDWTERHMEACPSLTTLYNAFGNEPAAASNASVIEKIIPPAVPLRRPFSLTTQNLSRKQNLADNEETHENLTKPTPSLRSTQQNNPPHQSSGVNGILNNNRPFENKAQNVQNQNGKLQENRFRDKVQIVKSIDNRPQNNKPQNNRHQYNRYQDYRSQDNRQQINRNQNYRPTEDRAVRKPQRESENAREQEWSTDSQSVEKLTQSSNKPWQKQTANSMPARHAPNRPPIEAAKAKVPNATVEKNILIKPATLDDVTPTRKIVPKKCLVEMLSPGDVVMLSADSKASECRCSDGDGFVCLSLHEHHQDEYAALCDEYAAACEADAAKYTPVPGVTFSYLNPEDGAWYRARCLTNELAALIDSSKLVTVSPADSLRQLPDRFAAMPEFSCLLKADGVKIGDSLKCTLKTKIPGGGYTASIEHAETGNAIGEGEILRWLPDVDYPPQPTASAISPSAGLVIPEVSRPDVVDGSKVLLVEATEAGRVLVRPADAASQRRYDSVLHAVALYGREASPLKVPPQKGQFVVAKYTDDLHYRAMCKRTNVKQNKYLIEYIEFGNTEISTMENMCLCPPEFDLSNQPTEAAVVALRADIPVFTAAATEYVEKLKENAAELILTICSGAKTAPSGVEVILTVADTKVSVNKRLEELCTPEWKKMEQKGVDVVEAVALMYSDLDHTEIPADSCEIDVLDISSLECGLVSGCVKGQPLAKKILEELPKQMEAYCNSDIGREPYLPMFEELCVAQCPPYPQWFRAVMCEQEKGAGGEMARICFVDYGNVEDVEVGVLRKMMPEFVTGLPALAAHLEIRDFPKEPTKEMLARALEHMKINSEGRGFLKVTRSERVERGLYVVDAPALIAAMLG